MKELIDFYTQNASKLSEQLLEHLSLTLFSVLLACILSIPLGIFIAKRKRWSSLILNFTGILQTIPSIALLGFLIPVLGIGVKPAIFALFLYSLLPIVRNVYTGITEIDPSVRESAIGMGMSFWQCLFKVELPLALPTIFAGIRTATVINVGVATLAAYIAAGGLGEFIFGGIALNNTTMIFAGALPAALLAILLDFLLGLLQRSGFSKMKRNLGFTTVFMGIFILISAFRAGTQTKLTAGFTPEFTGRQDGLPALKKVYGLKISNVVLGPALMYKAIHEGYVDVISGYSTDGRIKSYKLEILADDQNSFPPYEAALLIRQELITKDPHLKEVISRLNGLITDSIMMHLNYLVDHRKTPLQTVARNFLKSVSLFRESGKANKTLVMGSKIFTEQYILNEIYKQLIEGHTGYRVETKQGLGGTQICFDALTNGEIDMYPEYSGTVQQVILHEERKIDETDTVLFRRMQRQMASRYALYYSEPIGFNNTYAIMIREEQARKLNIHTVSQLTAFLKES